MKKNVLTKIEPLLYIIIFIVIVLLIVLCTKNFIIIGNNKKYDKKITLIETSAKAYGEEKLEEIKSKADNGELYYTSEIKDGVKYYSLIMEVKTLVPAYLKADNKGNDNLINNPKTGGFLDEEHVEIIINNKDNTVKANMLKTIDLEDKGEISA